MYLKELASRTRQNEHCRNTTGNGQIESKVMSVKPVERSQPRLGVASVRIGIGRALETRGGVKAHVRVGVHDT